jgi:hypothetical protein
LSPEPPAASAPPSPTNVPPTGYAVIVSLAPSPRLLEAGEKMRAEHRVDVQPVVANLADEDAVCRSRCVPVGQP